MSVRERRNRADRLGKTPPVKPTSEVAHQPGQQPAALFEVTASDVAMTNDEWYTPRWIFDAAGLTFDLDVCAPVAPEFRTCPARRYLTVLDDGLATPWDGLVWMNPPYSNPAPWVARFVAHPTGLALVPAANSPWRGSIVSHADGMALLTGSSNKRQTDPTGFGRPDGSRASYPTALILVARGAVAVGALEAVAMADPYAAGAYHVRPTLEQIPEPQAAAQENLL